MNLLAAVTDNRRALGRVFNTACQRKTSLLEVYTLLEGLLKKENPQLRIPEKVHLPNRKGDIQHSLADISAAKKELGYEPLYFFEEGLKHTVHWMSSLDTTKGFSS
jgi:nucleoside-diphosphate-sugar epimerase